jgi:stage IV sporulation protein B
VIAGGQPIGIYVETDGVLVLGTTAVTDTNGNTQNPAQNIVVKGDYIVAVNGTQIHYKSELIEKTQQSGGDALVLTLRRNETLIKVRVVPVLTALNEDASDTDSGVYRLGIWVRDDTQGIGTLTFCTSDGTFGALGHGVSDVDTGDLLESDTGSIYQASISYVVKGESGAPGELVGSIDYSNANQLGLITNNTACGIFGKGNAKLQQYDSSQSLPVGLKSEVQTGSAVIRSAFTGQMQEYTVEIEQVHVDDAQGTPDMVVKVTDEKLLSITGGIVQGLSGSPIIQNGKIIGALTHVFVKDPTKGYGIFIEDMLEQTDS